MKDPKKLAFKIFDDMKAGEKALVSVFAPRNPDLFIQLGKQYIDDGGDLMFSEDYATIYKTTPLADIIATADQFETLRNDKRTENDSEGA